MRLASIDPTLAVLLVAIIAVAAYLLTLLNIVEAASTPIPTSSTGGSSSFLVGPTLQVDNSPFESGELQLYSFSGFQPNATVTVLVIGGGGVIAPADNNGAGQFSFGNVDPPGLYTLVAQDDFSNVATTTFEIALSVPDTADLSVLNSPMPAGGVLQYSFSGFQPNEQVIVYVKGGGGVSPIADSTGAGQSSFLNVDPLGTYKLVAVDRFGNRGTAMFIIADPAEVPVVSLLWLLIFGCIIGTILMWRMKSPGVF